MKKTRRRKERHGSLTILPDRYLPPMKTREPFHFHFSRHNQDLSRHPPNVDEGARRPQNSVYRVTASETHRGSNTPRFYPRWPRKGTKNKIKKRNSNNNNNNNKETKTKWGREEENGESDARSSQQRSKTMASMKRKRRPKRERFSTWNTRVRHCCLELSFAILSRMGRHVACRFDRFLCLSLTC